MKWQGQCPDCGAWNSLAESVERDSKRLGQAASGVLTVAELPAVEAAQVPRIESGIGELDRVLGGGLVVGSAVLIGGDPGIGKSTLLLTALARLSGSVRTCYVSGEESLQQIALRARRLGVADAAIDLIADTLLEAIVAALDEVKPQEP